MAEWREALQSRDRLVALQNELDVARGMQQSILPTRFPKDPSYAVYGKMQPARNVGGDFFDVMYLNDGRVGLAVADVSDKGVPAALFMMSSRTLLKGAAIGVGLPGEVLREVNDLLIEDNEGGMFVTLLYAVYDPSSRELTYANGGAQQSPRSPSRRDLRTVSLNRWDCPGDCARPLLQAEHGDSIPWRLRDLLHRRCD